MKLTREFYIPKNATEVRDEAAKSVVYLVDSERPTSAGLPPAVICSAVGFAGNAQKPTFHFRFRTPEQRTQYIEQFFQAQRRRIEERTQRRKERAAFRHNVQVGDVFYTSWGYDQTNVEYFEVVALRGKTQVLIREIAKHYESTGDMQGRSAPGPGEFLADSHALGRGNSPKVCTVRQSCSLRIDDVRSAWRLPYKQIGSLKVYETRHESSYA